MSPATCPDCEKPIADGQCVSLAVSLSAGDDAGGTETTVRLIVCAPCGQKLMAHYVPRATNARILLARQGR